MVAVAPSVVSEAFCCGIDEVGRGPLAGPVVAAAVILPPNCVIEGLTDSKKLSEKKRMLLSEVIKEQALSYGIGEASAEEIDAINILQATFLAMQRALDTLTVAPAKIMVDGSQAPRFYYQGQEMVAETVIKGDQKVMSIAAASVIAKVYRDTLMGDVDKAFPGYNFARHKGYGTKEHLRCLQQQGPCPQHRRSFRPVTESVCKNHHIQSLK